ncbi:MAG TPA: hypothetical protein VFA60_14060 [Terriglobales bacterium]|nr:hypothetical protein [Terriglobales bacterium]
MRYGGFTPADWAYLLSGDYHIFGGFANVAAVAAQNSEAQLQNPTGSGKQAFLRELWVSLATAGDVVLTSFATQLGTDDGAGVALHFGGGAAKSHVRHTTNAGIQGTQFGRFSLPAGQAVNVLKDWDVALDPNSGLLVAAVTVNVAMIASFVWSENN